MTFMDKVYTLRTEARSDGKTFDGRNADTDSRKRSRARNGAKKIAVFRLQSGLSQGGFDCIHQTNGMLQCAIGRENHRFRARFARNHRQIFRTCIDCQIIFHSIVISRADSSNLRIFTRLQRSGNTLSIFCAHSIRHTPPA